MDITKLNTVGISKPPNPSSRVLEPPYTGVSEKASVPKAIDPENRKLKTACNDFEAILVQFMFKSMKKTVPETGFLGGGYQQDMYESMFFQEVATKLARERGFGIGEALYRQLQKHAIKNGQREPPRVSAEPRLMNFR
jgi:flagellar protein FlgJ